MKTKLVFPLICVTALGGYAAAGEKPWIEVKSPHFRVLTDSGAGDARLVAKEFEDFRALMAARYPNFRLESGAPLVIFAAKVGLLRYSLVRSKSHQHLPWPRGKAHNCFLQAQLYRGRQWRSS
jgi:hypothetical protein